MTRHELVPAELTADEYGSIWYGEPGADGSVRVGDLLYHTDGETATIRIDPVEDWHTVSHDPDGVRLGGRLVTDDECEDGGHLVIMRWGDVPPWMTRELGTNAFTFNDPCPDCSGSGIMGGPGSYYDSPGRGKPCGTCHGRCYSNEATTP